MEKCIDQRAVLSSWKWSIHLNAVVFILLLQIVFTVQIILWICPLIDAKGVSFPAMLSICQSFDFAGDGRC